MATMNLASYAMSAAMGPALELARKQALIASARRAPVAAGVAAVRAPAPAPAPVVVAAAPVGYPEPKPAIPPAAIAAGVVGVALLGLVALKLSRKKR